MKILAPLLLVSSAIFAQSQSLPELIDAARQGPASPGLKDRITRTLGVHGGNAVWGQDYLFVSESPSEVTISIDQQPATAMSRIEGSDFWMLLKKMRTGVTHSISVLCRGKAAGRARRCNRLQPRFLSQTRRAERQTRREAHHHQQDFRRHEVRLLGLRVAGRGSVCSGGADGVAGRARALRRNRRAYGCSRWSKTWSTRNCCRRWCTC